MYKVKCYRVPSLNEDRNSPTFPGFPDHIFRNSLTNYHLYIYTYRGGPGVGGGTEFESENKDVFY